MYERLGCDWFSWVNFFNFIYKRSLQYFVLNATWLRSQQRFLATIPAWWVLIRTKPVVGLSRCCCCWSCGEVHCFLFLSSYKKSRFRQITFPIFSLSLLWLMLYLYVFSFLKHIFAIKKNLLEMYFKTSYIITFIF